MLRTRAKFHGQQIKIGENIFITPYYENGKPHIGIDAPKEIKIDLNYCEDAENENRKQ